MKFKIGDKVKILPSAVSGGVSKSEVGKIGILTKYNNYGDYFLVVMDKSKYTSPWAVKPYHIERVRVVGEQLLLWEDM